MVCVCYSEMVIVSVMSLVIIPSLLQNEKVPLHFLMYNTHLSDGDIARVVSGLVHLGADVNAKDKVS